MLFRSLTTPEYLKPGFAKGFKNHRLWLESADLFKKDARGLEVLSNEGKVKLDEAMTEILKYPRNGPLMLEGFSGEGSAAQQHLVSRRRAVRVQVYITDRFHLRPAYVGVVSMGTVKDAAGVVKEGVGIVSFYK